MIITLQSHKQRQLQGNMCHERQTSSHIDPSKLNFNLSTCGIYYIGTLTLHTYVYSTWLESLFHDQECTAREHCRKYFCPTHTAVQHVILINKQYVWTLTLHNSSAHSKSPITLMLSPFKGL